MSKVAGFTCLFVFILALHPVEAPGGGHPFRTLVVVNRDSDRSLELGRYYAVRRGIPDGNICPVFTTNRINITTTAYSNEIEAVVRDFIVVNGLSNQIDTVVFSMDIPYRVYIPPHANLRWSGLTASFYYGFFSSPSAFTSGCQIAEGSRSDYFEAERYFSRAESPVSNRYYLSAMLTASNLANGLRLVDRSVAADNSSPFARIILTRTSDTARNIQWLEFENTLFLGKFISAPQERFWVDLDFIASQTNLFGVTAGLINHSWLGLNNNLPGAYGEHLTSFGGYLVDSKPEPTQMSILDWIYHGFSGSYGTVVEPCAFTNKFPSPRIHYWYARGFSLGESLWMAVQNPYQGIFVGDPLCAPYAVPASVSWLGITNQTEVNGWVSLTGRVIAASFNRPAKSISWWRAGRFQDAVSEFDPLPGNQVEVVINGTSRVYTVQGGDSLFSVAAGMANVLNQPPSLGIIARASGDRIDIRQILPGISATGWSVQAWTHAGTAGTATVHAHTPITNFTETTHAARKRLEVSGASRSGDVVRAVVTRLDGGFFTNTVVVTNNFTAPLIIMNTLLTAINNDTNLQGVIGCVARYARTFQSSATVTNAEIWLFSRTNTWEGYNLDVDFTISNATGSTLAVVGGFPSLFSDNVNNTTARGTVFLYAGVTQLFPVIEFDSFGLPDGPHEVALSVREGTGVGTESDARINLRVKNHDMVCALVMPPAYSYRLKSGYITVEVATVSSMNVTQIVLLAEGKPIATGLTSSLTFSLPLDWYGAGPLNLQAQSWDDGLRSTLSAPAIVQLYTDEDGDGLSDQWEYRHFGGITNYNGMADPDGDGYSNREEFFADTQPTNAASFLSVTEVVDGPGLRFFASTNRRYRIQLNDSALTNYADWFPAGDWFAGMGGMTTWLDATTNAPPTTNNFRFYAIEPLPR
ncbi:MAG TPA: TIGR03790 family protein [Kiritimatiellia bacterium]|nr:TIGR03790 family protein [Kiritimatiellia bacterium]